ncbi:TetR/AcrR family transcriptional regulator [Streptomyces sporangiiformans]|uniref:TetR/AcrR family transcriptional regulator n=1 Tax=Streptomyces sporangiiformans TaxID=2315329 RepID=A0A505D8A9_9ACTN|nr:TetR/AcrR family transcriptional regulator [Streptomyces sporangiiformans]TPQ18840.1 TetR/AcrR family transcriptional regulator [Streptomyces sporangiiformans]
MTPDKQAFPSVWTRPRKERREQPVLSRGQIVKAALELLDAEGLEALSMRKLGARLNAGATSMYSHVANKDELIELVVDEVFGEIEIPGEGESVEWRAAVRRCARSLRAAFLRHPWVASVLGEAGLAYLGPNMMRFSDAMLGVFEDAGFSLEQADQAVTTVGAYTMGVAITEAAWLTTVNRSGQSEQEWMERLLPAAEEAARDAYPRLQRLYAAQRERAAKGGALDDSFDDGLASVLDGLEARLKAGGA